MTPLGLSRDQWHRYSWNDGTEVRGPLLGVTSALKLQDVLMGGDLAAWGGRIAAGYVTHRLAQNPLRPDRDREEEQIVDDALKEVSKARDIGTIAHDAIAKILLRQPVVPTTDTAPYIYAFSSFLAEERPEFIGVEQMVANLRYGYAGTFDFAAKLRGRVALVDVKTGKLKLSHRLQLAGYAACEFIGVEGDPQKHPIPKFRAYYILLLRPGSYELVEMEVTSADRRHFLNLVKTYHRLREWDAAAQLMQEEAYA